VLLASSSSAMCIRVSHSTDNYSSLGGTSPSSSFGGDAVVVSQDLTVADGVDAFITLRRSSSEAGLRSISAKLLPDELPGTIERGTLLNGDEQQP
jgi:hypothetical protein